MEENFFEELNQVDEEEKLEEYCRGREDAYKNKIVESNATDEYINGYNDFKHSQKVDKFKEWVKNNEAAVKRCIRNAVRNQK